MRLQAVFDKNNLTMGRIMTKSQRGNTLYEDADIEIVEFQKIAPYTKKNEDGKSERVYKIRKSIGTLRKRRDPTKLRSDKVMMTEAEINYYEHCLDGKV